MSDFLQLLKGNRNYRYTWSGQVVSEIGDHFNNIAVFSLALANTRSGMVVTGVMLARAIPAVMAGPLAGVVLDRMDRKQIMIVSDLIRAVVALGFILAINRSDTWLLYLLSAMLMLASPFFTSGRSGDSSQHRQQRRAAHRELADANHRLGHANRGRISGRRKRRAVWIQVGIRFQRVVISIFRRMHF